MQVFLSIFIGILFGGLQFFLLLKGVRSVAKGQLNVLYFIAQFFCPLAGLGLCVWLAPDFLILTASIICGILFLGAICYKIHIQKQTGKKV